MKGIAHFLTGVALATCFPDVVALARQGSLLPVLGGIGAALPDLLDFRFLRYFERLDLEIDPGSLPDYAAAEAVAEALVRTMREAFEGGAPRRVIAHTVRLGVDCWRRYTLRFDPHAGTLSVVMGPLVTTGGAEVPRAMRQRTLQRQAGQAGERQRTLQRQAGQAAERQQTLQRQAGQAVERQQTLQRQAGQAVERQRTLQRQAGQAVERQRTLQRQAGQAVERRQTLQRQTGQAAEPPEGIAVRALGFPLADMVSRQYDIDIFTGPSFTFRRVDDRLTVDFLDWHHRWTHSLALAVVVGVCVGACVSLGWGSVLGRWAALVAMLGAAAHALEDQLGHMGCNLLWPLTRERTPGLGLLHAGDPLPNFLVVWTSLALILFNLDRFGGPGSLPRGPYLLLAIGLPWLLIVGTYPAGGQRGASEAPDSAGDADRLAEAEAHAD
jgi:membrane-bound metal-dependent hydrolase YbcI (DUF457 family)